MIKMKSLSKNTLWAIVTLLMVALIFSFIYSERDRPEVLNINQLVAKVNNEEIYKIIVSGNNLAIELRDGTKAVSKKEVGVGLTETFRNYGVSPAVLQAVALKIKEPSGLHYWLGILLPVLLPLLIIVAILWFILRQAKGGMGQAFNFGKANIKLFSAFKDKVFFKDIAGLKESKEELLEVVDFLKRPKKYLNIGARIPRGVLLLGLPGTGKCITGESLVLTNKGLLPIEEIPKYFTIENDRVIGAKVLSFNQDNFSFEWQEPSHWFNLGRSKTIKIKTQLGTTIEGTPEHPIITLNNQNGNLEFKNLENIKQNDQLLISYNHQVFGNYNKIRNEEVAYFMGLLTGDGGLTTKRRITFTSADQELVDKFKQITKKIWNYEPIKKGKYDYHIFDKNIKNDLVRWGLQEVYSENKTIPENILLAPKNIITAFLRGIFDTDGYCDSKKNNMIELSSSSRDLIFSAHHLLLNLGIVNRIHERRKNYNNKLQYYISISGDFLSVFKKEINFALNRKRVVLEKILKKPRNTNNNLIYRQNSHFKNIWLTLKASGFRANREFYRQSFYKNIFRYISGDRNPSVSATVKILSFAQSVEPAIIHHPSFNYLNNLSQSKSFFSEVVEIKEGEDDVYDFTVPGNHSFIANSLISHNTLLARAVAGEANVPFFHISGSEFVEMFVGVGASRVRDLFQTAKKASPSIIFIDEIDAIGRERGAGLGGGHDEREQTLNQILVEMDGFDRETKVIILAATNRPDVLDPALLRPGRFDRRVILDLPDINDREAILKIHSKDKPLTKDVNLHKVAMRTPGFSGADLANLMNEAALFSARKNQLLINNQNILDSIEKIILGPERRSRVVPKKEKEIIAYHEAGHALVTASLENADPVQKISVVARGRAGGYTLKLPTEESHLRTKSQFLADLAVMFSGYISEQVIFGDISTGASNDIKEASALARKLVTKFGMNKNLGPISFGKSHEMVFLGREMTTEKDYSEKVAAEIDDEVKILVNESFQVAKKIITNHKKALKAIAEKLIKDEVIEKEEFDKLIKSFKLKKIRI